MYHLKLCKGRSYSGIVSATRDNPDVLTADIDTANEAVRTSYFKIIEAPDAKSGPQHPSNAKNNKLTSSKE